MKGVNKTILVGNLGNDPETRTSQNGRVMASISIATSETWKDKQTGEQKQQTEWHRVKFFDRLAEIVGQYLKKGSKVYIEGSSHTQKYTDKQGVEKYDHYVKAREMQMLDSRGDNQASSQQYQAPQQQAPQYQQQVNQQQAHQPYQQSGPDDFDDDIHF